MNKNLVALALAAILQNPAGAMAQNVALYCASEGLGCVVRGWINHRLLSDALKLNEDELPILAQTVGAVGTTLTSLAD